MSDPNQAIEQQLFSLSRRTLAVQTLTGGYELERSSYGILSLLADKGPQRLGQIAQTFRLDPSTITRQVQAVVRLGLAEKRTDPHDRRATLLSLTPAGLAAVTNDQASRRLLVQQILADWTATERQEFLRFLTRFNETIDTWIESGRVSRAPAEGLPAGTDGEPAVSALRKPTNGEPVPGATR